MVFVGPMLWVLRPKLPADRFGDTTYERHHQVGPVAVSDPGGSTESERQERVVSTISYTAAPDADVRETDRIETEDGSIYTVESVEAPRNPFTGWTPFITFTVKAVD